MLKQVTTFEEKKNDFFLFRLDVKDDVNVKRHSNVSFDIV